MSDDRPIIIPTEAVVSFTFETSCPTCGHPHIQVIKGGIAASGYYHIKGIAHPDDVKIEDVADV